MVDDEARGLGIGEKLVMRCIEFVKEENGRNLCLQSFKKLKIALTMYNKMGFKNASAPEGMVVVNRTDIIYNEKRYRF